LVDPEICHNCGNPLDVVYEKRYGENWKWNGEIGKYEIQDVQIILNYCCFNCDTPVGGWKANGESWGYIPDFGEKHNELQNVNVK